MKHRFHKFSLPRPGEHGQILVHPSMQEALEGAQKNIKHFDSLQTGRGQGFSIAHRNKVREELMSLAVQYGRGLGLSGQRAEGESGGSGISGPLMVTGHQCQFYHCGVLIKYLLADYLAQEKEGMVLNLVVDSDLPKGIHLRVPVKNSQGASLSEGSLLTREITLEDVQADVPMEYQPKPAENQIRQFIEQLSDASGCIPELKDAVSRVSDLANKAWSEADNMRDFFTLLNHGMIRSMFGIDALALPVSVMAQSVSFRSFCVNLLNQGSLVHKCYNEALDKFCEEQGVSDSRRPLANLGLMDDRGTFMEMPFWVFRPDRSRRTLWVGLSEGAMIFHDGIKNICRIAVHKKGIVSEEELHKCFVEYGWSLRPKAIMLTVFTRMYLADIFVHGIGGAYYDQVADEFIRRFYPVDEPSFVCTSASMNLPLGDYPPSKEAVKQLNQARCRKRDLFYNPQRYIEPGKAEDLLRQRREAIEESSLLSGKGELHDRRRGIFDRIRRLNAQVREAMPEKTEQFCLDEQQAIGRVCDVHVANDREYFFGLFPERQLRELCRKLKNPS